MDRASFLELVLPESGEVTIERWKDGKAKRERVTFREACKLQGEEIFVCLGQNGTIRTLASDTDDREIMLPPSVSSETSKDRFENLWLFPNGITRHEAEIMLTYLDPHSPPVVREKLRLPDTVSVKHGEPFTVRIAEASGKPYTPAQVFGISAPVETVGFVDMAWLKTPGPFDAGSLDKAVAWLSKRKNADRETKSWMERTDLSMRSLILRLLKKGFDERDTIWLTEASASNPFREWKYGVREELAKILVIARAAKGAMLLSDRINHVRGGKTGPNQRPFQLRNTMAKIAMEDFERNAQLLHATDSTLWAVDRRTGVAMEVVHGSQPIRHYITARYGINPVDVDHKHLLEEMIRVVTARPNTAEVTSISHFQVESGRMFVSFGGREVVVLSKDGISLQENGTDGIIFKPVQGADVLATKLLPIEEALEGPAGGWWQKILPPEHLKNLVRGDPQEVSVLLYIWTLFFMFRNMAASRPIGMFLGPAGCLAGDTPVMIRRRGGSGGRNSGRTYRLEDIYRWSQGDRTGKGRGWDLSLPTEVLSEKNGQIRYRRVRQFLCSGVKETYTVQVDGEEPFRATLDHRFQTPFGWRTLGELQPGSHVLVGAKRDLKGCRTVRHHRRTVKARYHPGARQKYVTWKTLEGEKTGLYPSIVYARAVVEARINGLSIEQFLHIVQHDEEKAKTLTYLEPKMTVHHKDEDPSNDDEKNLVALTKAEHDALHGEENTRNFGNHLELQEREVISIEPYGQEMTYDIEMEDGEAPNFLVNNVIVHNSGKTTLSKKLHLLFYGKGVKLFTVKSNQDYWVTTTSNYPLTMFDNVDAPTPWWLPSALAVSITPTDVTKRTLYSNNTPYVQRMDSIVALSSHDASFLKDDVIDRAILVQFSRIAEEERLEEMPMLDAVINNREELLAGMMADVVRVLRTERPLATKGSAIRIVDFAAIGRWIARALGVEDTFLSALNDLSVHQTAKVLEEDIVLVMSLETMQEESAYCDEWLTHTQIWNEIIALSEDRGESFKSQYKNTAAFGRKMLAIYTQLHDAIGVESRDDVERGWKLYRIGSKQRRDRERKKQLGLDIENELE